METIVETSRAYGKTCHGCVISKRAVMLSFSKEGAPSTAPIHDFFLTKADAARLHTELGERLKQNEEAG